MLLTFDAVAAMINGGYPMQIAGSETLLRKLPKGNWIGGSTEYFMTEEGGRISGEMLFVTEFPYNYTIQSYGAEDIDIVAVDAYDNGFSILIIPFDSAVHRLYAENAAGFPSMFMKNITGWISGVNLSKIGQTPIAVNGVTGEAYSDKAVALHLEVPAGKTVRMNIINLFSQDAGAPLIEFEEEGFSVRHCLVDGKKTVMNDYIAEREVDPRFPLVGDYSGVGVNISIKSIENGIVNFYAPVFSGIEYRFAKPVSDYAGAFNERIAQLKNVNAAFACNCILNFLYGGLEYKRIEAFAGPITFGEIAYQLVNQTLVYVTVSD